MLFFLATITTLGAAGDIRVMRSAGTFHDRADAGLPIVLIFVAMFYWLWRARIRQTFVWAK